MKGEIYSIFELFVPRKQAEDSAGSTAKRSRQRHGQFGNGMKDCLDQKAKRPLAQSDFHIFTSFPGGDSKKPRASGLFFAPRRARTTPPQQAPIMRS
jgi:hypothetical protein